MTNKNAFTRAATSRETSGAQPLIAFRGVSKRFGPRVILDNVDLDIYEGEVTTVIGKSGVGKSVCLKHIVGLLHPDEGQILYRGKPVSTMSREERRAFKHTYSYMFQNCALFDSMTVFDNIALPLKERDQLSMAEIRQKVEARLAQLDLTEVPDKYPSQISGGMQKRVALGRALVTDPSMIMFDEPTTGLDPIRKNAVLSMIAHYQRQFGFTAVVVSHEIPDVFYISNRIAILYEGKFIFQGPPVDLEQLNHPVVSEFANSLKSLKDELTGLDTRQQFERRYEAEFPKLVGEQKGAIILFAIDNLQDVDEHVGHIAAHRIIQGLANSIDQYVGAAGYSARFSPNEILTVLPEVSLDDAKHLVGEIGNAMSQMRVTHPGAYPSVCYNFAIKAGVVSSTPDKELKELAAQAKEEVIVLSTLKCEPQSK